MAKLGAYYGLCPLIDHRSLLGISPDQESGVIIVTLGKNIAIKFKLSDQKQLCSWRTKDKFTSPIIYDSEQSIYVAAFNDSFIRTWSDSEEYLDKLKKIKFNQQIQTIFGCDGKVYVVFKTGDIMPIKMAIEQHNSLLFKKYLIPERAHILDVLYATCNELCIGLVVTVDEESYLYWGKGECFNSKHQLHKLIIQRGDVQLKGYTFHISGSTVNFLSLWSDGRIYSVVLKEDTNDIGELLTSINSPSCKEYVSLKSLDENYIALYGCNPNEEGALLIIYNVQFKVEQARQPFKLFTNGAKLWRLNENLLFPVGQNFAVLPFYLDVEQLAALIGSHKIDDNNEDPDISIVYKVHYGDWGQNGAALEMEIDDSANEKLQDLATQGMSKNMIFEFMLSDVMERMDVQEFRQVLCNFSDISEENLVQAIKFVLLLSSDKFVDTSTVASLCFPQELQPFERIKLLDVLLTKQFNDVILLNNLRLYLSLDQILLMLRYIIFLFSEDGHLLPNHTVITSEGKLIGWCCILLDSNYQKLILTKDQTVKDTLKSLKGFMEKELENMNDCTYVASLLHELQKGQLVDKNTNLIERDYAIEEFSLY